MPLNNPSPNFALLSAFNARTWSNVNVFDRGSNNVTLPTFATGEGIFDDAISFLNGRGSESGFAMSDLLQATAPFGTSWSVTINSSDKVVISCNDQFKIRFKSGVDVLGVGSSSFSTAATSFTCPNDWTRGSYLQTATYAFLDSSDSNLFSFAIQGGLNAQDLIVAIRERGTVNDVDDVNSTNCLEKLDLNANTASTYIKWYINDNGHVECMYSNAVGDVAWVSTTFRDRLGFSGNETPSGTLTRTLTADYPLPGTLYPSRPYQDHHMQTQTVSQSRRKIGGGYASNFIGSYVQSILLFDLDALLDSIDLYRHFTNNFISFIGNGERITFYQNVGDSRRSLITSGVTLNQPAFDLLFTSEDNGNTGRIRCSLVDANTINLAYPNRLKRRVPVSLLMEHLNG
tara:strand:- start:901 stop:2103 length:1203 start_codon:yes stop_codon:yes gene_type:complete